MAANGADPILVGVDGPVKRITFNKPGVGNGLTPPLLRQLTAEFNKVTADSGIKVVVLRGNGADFCIGRDPTEVREPPPHPLAFREGFAKVVLGMYSALQNVPVPVIAGVQGKAYSMGCAMSNAADITIAADSATFCLPEMGFGVPPTLVMYAMLDRVSTKRIGHMAYTMAPIDALTAQRYGTVNEVVRAAELDAAVERTVAKLCQHSVLALSAVKTYLRRASYMDPVGATEFAANLLAVVVSSPAN